MTPHKRFHVDFEARSFVDEAYALSCKLEIGQSPMVARDKRNRDEEQNPAQDIPEKTDLIARHLKAVYDETVREPVPEELLKLLQELGKRA